VVFEERNENKAQKKEQSVKSVCENESRLLARDSLGCFCNIQVFLVFCVSRKHSPSSGAERSGAEKEAERKKRKERRGEHHS
jgi:hypothetical protein